MGIKDQYLDERFATPGAHPLLPFFHTCDGKFLQEILDTKELQPRYCKVYRETLLYLFYGKPAYKSADTTNSDFLYMMPISFIIAHDAVTTVKRQLPFDSGAFSMYKPHMHDSMTVKEFELTPTKGALNTVVNSYFGDNDSYFVGKAKSEIDYDPIHFQVRAYHSLITTSHRTEVDDRKASLEVQLDVAISLNNVNIEAIILPKMLAESDKVKDEISNKLGIKIIPYMSYGVASNNYYSDINEKARQYLIDKKLLNGS